MLKQNKVMLIVTSIVLLLPMAVGIILWNQLPSYFDVFWNAYDEGSSFATRVQGVFGLPGLMLLIHWLSVLVISIDPKRKDICDKSLTVVLWVWPVINLLLCGVLFVQAAGYGVHISMFLPMLMGIVFLMFGNYMPKCKQNYTIGIRVPWALEDEENWNATHRFAGKVFVIGGLIIFALPWLQVFWPFVDPMQSFWSAVSLWGFVAMILIMVLIPAVYSYLHYQKNKQI